MFSLLSAGPIQSVCSAAAAAAAAACWLQLIVVLFCFVARLKVVMFAVAARAYHSDYLSPVHLIFP